MQDILTRMVTFVREGALGGEEASRVMHECAALLHLPLLNPLPRDTLIVSGMTKTVKANDVIRAFRRFGPIEDAAVAANQRGFGKCICSSEGVAALNLKETGQLTYAFFPVCLFHQASSASATQRQRTKPCSSSNRPKLSFKTWRFSANSLMVMSGSIAP